MIGQVKEMGNEQRVIDVIATPDIFCLYRCISLIMGHVLV